MHLSLICSITINFVSMSNIIMKCMRREYLESCDHNIQEEIK